jgi:hypothetical protein
MGRAICQFTQPRGTTIIIARCELFRYKVIDIALLCKGGNNDKGKKPIINSPNFRDSK